MRFLTILVLLLIVCGGCRKDVATSPVTGTVVTSQSRDFQTAQLRQKLRSVTTADGISKSEAEIIAECYFHQNVGCGGFTGIRDGGDYWIIDGAIGYAAAPIKNFRIYKHTGKVSSTIGPSYENPLEIFP